MIRPILAIFDLSFRRGDWWLRRAREKPGHSPRQSQNKLHTYLPWDLSWDSGAHCAKLSLEKLPAGRRNAVSWKKRKRGERRRDENRWAGKERERVDYSSILLLARCERTRRDSPGRKSCRRKVFKCFSNGEQEFYRIWNYHQLSSWTRRILANTKRVVEVNGNRIEVPSEGTIARNFWAICRVCLWKIRGIE